MRNLVVVCSLALVTGCVAAQPAPPAPVAAQSTAGPRFTRDAKAGEALFAVCNSCHDPEFQRPMGPPMYGVKRKYKQTTVGREAFISKVVAYVTAPSNEAAMMVHAVKKFGLMPALPLGKQPLRHLAAYIYEEEFAPPCMHWQSALADATAAGDTDQATRHEALYAEFCK